MKTSHQKPIDRDQVRMMVADFGFNETAKRLGLKPNTIRQWSVRGKWNQPIQTNSRSVTRVTKPIVNAHQEALQALESETKLNLAKYAQKASGSARGSLKEAGSVHKVAQIAAVTHNWGANANSGNNILNVAVLTGQTPGRPSPTISVDSQSTVLPSVEA